MSEPSSRAPFLSVLRELVSCYQAFERYAAAHVQGLGLTLPQFDVIATLGRTSGLSFRDLGNRTLITKGTLTGVVDRLQAKGIVSRRGCPEDGRSTLVCLTRRGEKIFDAAFPAHVEHMREAFGKVCSKELAGLEHGLKTLNAALCAASREKEEA